MCPVVFLAILGSFLFILVEVVSAFSVAFDPSIVNVKEGDFQRVNFSISQTADPQPLLANWNSYLEYEVRISDEDVATITGERKFVFRNDTTFSNMSGEFLVVGKFMGQATVSIAQTNGSKNENEDLKVIVRRKQSVLSTIFTVSVAVLVSLNYVNMGCAMDLNVVNSVLRHPIAPAVGIMSQCVIMPVTAYLLGWWLLAEATHLRLGLFVFGCSPAGGASNMWTVLLNGNLDLSITMTFISTLLATGVLPLWMYTLGKQIYADTTTIVPLRNILTTLFTMAVCLSIGLSFQRFLPRVAAYCKKILAPVSVAMIIFIITFGTYANWYMFKLMNARILWSAGFCVWLGFLGGYAVSSILRFPSKDRTAISIETGIQNTGIAIVLLGVSLPPPYNDIASVVPVAASIMTPIPLTIALLGMKCMSWYRRRNGSQSLRCEDMNRTVSNSSSSTLISADTNGLTRTETDVQQRGHAA